MLKCLEIKKRMINFVTVNWGGMLFIKRDKENPRRFSRTTRDGNSMIRKSGIS